MCQQFRLASILILFTMYLYVWCLYSYEFASPESHFVHRVNQNKQPGFPGSHFVHRVNWYVETSICMNCQGTYVLGRMGMYFDKDSVISIYPGQNMQQQSIHTIHSIHTKHAIHIYTHGTFFPPTVFHFFPTKITFSPDGPDPSFFFPISVTTALTKTLTYPSTFGAYPKRRGAVYDVP